MSLKPQKGMIEETDPRVTMIGHPAPPWMVNYADLMTELVCFYLILYALGAALNKPTQVAAQEVESVMKKKDTPGNVTVTKDGLVISLEEQGFHVFFKSGSAEMTDEMKKILDDLAPTFADLAAKHHEMIVEGHTDDVPIHTDRYGSNWELSSARATEVVKYLVYTHGFPPKNIAAIGYGDNKNLARQPDEDTEAWRSRNRRVVFLIKSPLTPTKGAGAPPPTKVAEVSDAKGADVADVTEEP
jgi:flagellar motor protein MotB